jgi:hypothetical protein
MLRPLSQLCTSIAICIRKSELLISLPLPSQPLALEIFYGRDEYVTEIASLMVKHEQMRITILGMGKTLVAIHIMHHSNVVAKYFNRRYFVGCDAVESADTLALLILKTLQIPLSSKANNLDVLHRSLSSAPNTLIVLNNFETVWNADNNHAAVRNLLQKVVGVTSASLIITSRGDTSLQGIKWTRSTVLPPLSLEAAESCFWDLSPGVEKNAEEAQDLESLLGELDCMPLAIHLIAQSCSGFAPGYMLKLWLENKTALLQTREDEPDKLESIEVSVSLSISALRNADNHEAIRLLSILCLLPDGLHRWDEQRTAINTKYENLHWLLQSLRRTSLIFFAGNTLKVLSPIRHIVNSHHPASEDDMKSLEEYFWDQAAKLTTLEPGKKFVEARKILEPEMGNPRSLLHNAAQKRPSVQVIDMAVKISQFLRWSHPSTAILDIILHLVLETAPLGLTAEFYHMMGDNLYGLSQYGEVTDVLVKDHKLFLTIPDRLGAACCLQRLGHKSILLRL